MNDLIIMYGLTIVLVFVVGLLLMLYRYFIGTKMTKAAAKLQSQMANIRRDFPHLERNPKEFIGQNIGEIGIDGLLDELGIPSVFKPLAKGFIDKVAQNPEMLAQIAERFGIKLPGGDENQQESQGINFV